MENHITAQSSQIRDDERDLIPSPHTHDLVDSHAQWHRRRREQAASDARLGEDSDLPIALEDHEEDHRDDSNALWAQAVIINNWTVIGGGAIGGSYVVWNCTIQTLNGGPIFMRKRYSDFVKLRERLLKTFPHSEAALPILPRKSVISRFSPIFLEKRQAGLAYFINCVCTNPEFAGAPILTEFLFS